MAHRASVGIISIGEMGLGVANILISQNYRVLTNITGRSKHTHDRASRAAITLLQSDTDLVSQSDYILSIVPPKDALATANRIVSAHSKSREAKTPLYFLDLNAIAPSSAKAIAARFDSLGDAVRFVDGGIIGGPPKGEGSDFEKWNRPSIVLSGPHPLADAPVDGAHLAAVLKTKHVSDAIGTASGLKCCYASLTKGFTALAIQSWSTAAALGVVDELREEMRDGNAAGESRAAKGLVGMAPKSGRWVAEMQEIGKTFREEGGWGHEATGSNVFEEIAEVYRYIAEETDLGKEVSGNRVRGKTAEDVLETIKESRK